VEGSDGISGCLQILIEISWWRPFVLLTLENDFELQLQVGQIR
jgi:hypothetical protein